MSTKRSRVHPPYKTTYRVSNSAEYDQALTQRGSITFWFSSSAVKKWNAKPSGKRGGQAKYSDLAIERALTLGLVFHLPFRQTEGFVSSVFELMGLQLNVPDHSPVSRASARSSKALSDRASWLLLDTGVESFKAVEFYRAQYDRLQEMAGEEFHFPV